MDKDKKFEISEEEVDEFFKEYIKEQKNKKQLKIKFKEVRKDEVIEEIYEYLNTQDKDLHYIDNEDIAYFPEDYKFTSNEFDMIFDNLMEYCRNNKLDGVEPDNEFDAYNYYLKYKDMKILLRIMYGQGTCMQMRTDFSEYWNEDKSFTWEDYKNNNNLYTDDRKKKDVLKQFNEFLDSTKNETGLKYKEVINIIKENINNKEFVEKGV